MLPDELPVSLPSKLVEQRPDVRQAEENLHAASAAVGVALADMLPQFTISADTGSAALAIDQLFSPYTGFWDVGASLTQTLFDAGALLYRHRAADDALDAAGAQYRAAVILACQNVADTLRALQADADALKASAAADLAARAAFELAQRQHALGTLSTVALLNAEQTYQQAEDHPGPGAGQPLCRHGRAVPGARWRLVESSRGNLQMTQLVLRENRDGAAILTLNRPEKLNALSKEMIENLEEHVDQHRPRDQDHRAGDPARRGRQLLRRPRHEPKCSAR